MKPKHDNFIITAQGRSGTKFLSAVMDRSAKWTVRHEPKPRGVILDWGPYQERFSRDFYGEVNSLLRGVALEAPVAKKGVILRHPAEVSVSFYNRRLRRRDDPVKSFPKHAQGFHFLDELVRAGVPVIWFRRMVSEPAYLLRVLNHFGIDDVAVGEETLARPVNATEEKDRRVTTLAECGPAFRRLYDERVTWFEEKYFGDDSDADVPRQL